MGLDILLATREAAVVTDVTAPKKHPLQPEPAPHKAVTAVTDVTAKNNDSQTKHSHAPIQPATATAAVRCMDCSNAIPEPHHSALTRCAEGIESGTPVGAWWSLDPHHCGRFNALAGVYNAILEQAGRRT